MSEMLCPLDDCRFKWRASPSWKVTTSALAAFTLGWSDLMELALFRPAFLRAADIANKRMFTRFDADLIGWLWKISAIPSCLSGLPVFERRFPVLPIREFRCQSIGT